MVSKATNAQPRFTENPSEKLAAKTNYPRRNTEVRVEGNGEPSSGFAGFACRTWLKVGRASLNVKCEAVLEHLKNRFLKNDFTVEMQAKRDDARSVSFKVSAEMDLLDELQQIHGRNLQGSAVRVRGRYKDEWRTNQQHQIR
ncbi:hypothetical protein HHI36_000287 [Cryptolaemus montrouzieri]|uniref:Uncharacterized protein n=1 Tax=Cryptolaemus montrouzieri TaxID=559131 RepID=A0ABD2P4X1_9CUCU